MKQGSILFTTLLLVITDQSNSFVEIIVLLFMFLVFFVLGVSFFVKPLWVVRFAFSWIEMWLKILFRFEKLPPRKEKILQDILDPDSIKHKNTKGIAIFLGIVSFSFAFFILFILLNY